MLAGHLTARPARAQPAAAPIADADAIAARLTALGVQMPPAGLGALTTITIARPGETMVDADMALISQVVSLTSVSLSVLRQITPAGFAHLARLPRLERLYISGSPITAAGVAAIGPAPALRTLDLSTNRAIDDSAMVPIAAMRGLTSLSLPGTAVTGAGLLLLAGHPALQDMRIMGLAEVTDATMLSLARIPTLVSVNAARTQVTEAGVEAALAVPGRNARLRIIR
jgi:hypothetical protein